MKTLKFKTAKGTEIELKGKEFYRDNEKCGVVAEAKIVVKENKNCIHVYSSKKINYLSVSDADFVAVSEYLKPIYDAVEARAAYEASKVNIFVSALPDGLYEWRGVPTKPDSEIVESMTKGLKSCGEIKEEKIEEICINALKKYRGKIEGAKLAKEKEEKRVSEIKELAKATGEKQVLDSYTDDCDGSVYDCSFDNINVYAMPDGTTKTTRTHCY